MSAGAQIHARKKGQLATAVGIEGAESGLTADVRSGGDLCRPVLIELVIDQRRAQHQGFQRSLNGGNAMIDPHREATKLARAHSEAFVFCLDHKSSSQHNEALVTVAMGVKPGLRPTFVRVVIANP
jgi:hypothetical protein